jgi:hypothetical protein
MLLGEKWLGKSFGAALYGLGGAKGGGTMESDVTAGYVNRPCDMGPAHSSRPHSPCYVIP